VKGVVLVDGLTARGFELVALLVALSERKGSSRRTPGENRPFFNSTQRNNLALRCTIAPSRSQLFKTGARAILPALLQCHKLLGARTAVQPIGHSLADDG
jgi:hypothetical protein